MSKKSKARSKARNTGTSATCSRYESEIVSTPDCPLQFMMTFDAHSGLVMITATDNSAAHCFARVVFDSTLNSEAERDDNIEHAIKLAAAECAKQVEDYLAKKSA